MGLLRCFLWKLGTSLCDDGTRHFANATVTFSAIKTKLNPTKYNIELRGHFQPIYVLARPTEDDLIVDGLSFVVGVGDGDGTGLVGTSVDVCTNRLL